MSDFLIEKAEALEKEITNVIDEDLDEDDFDILMDSIIDNSLPEAIAAYFAAKYYLDDDIKSQLIEAVTTGLNYSNSCLV
jgi:hypothetical protein